MSLFKNFRKRMSGSVPKEEKEALPGRDVLLAMSCDEFATFLVDKMNCDGATGKFIREEEISPEDLVDQGDDLSGFDISDVDKDTIITLKGYMSETISSLAGIAGQEHKLGKLWSRIQEDEKSLDESRAAAAALADRRNPKSRKQLQELQYKLLQLWKQNDKQGANEVFNQMKQIGEDELQRLKILLEANKKKYTARKFRWDYILSIPSETISKIQPTPVGFDSSKNDVNAYMDCMFTDAQWIMESFFREVEALVKQFNEVKIPEGQLLGNVLQIKGKNDLEFDLTLKSDKEFMVLCETTEQYKIMVMKRGPLKRRERALEKVKYEYNTTEHKEPRGQHVVDVIRAELTFEDPYALAAFFALVKKNMKVVRVKNKFSVKDTDPEAEDTPPEIRTNLLMNIEYEIKRGGSSVAKQLVELQLTLSDFSKIKKEMHKYYEVVRAATPSAILTKPFFPEDEFLGILNEGK